MKRLMQAAVVAISTLSLSAYAALPAGVATMFTGISDDFIDLRDTYMWPLILTVTAAFIIVKLVKRGANKAT